MDRKPLKGISLHGLDLFSPAQGAEKTGERSPSSAGASFSIPRRRTKLTAFKLPMANQRDLKVDPDLLRRSETISSTATV